MKLKLFYVLFIILALLIIIISLITKIDATTVNKPGKTLVDPQQINDVIQNNITNSDTTFGIVVWDLNTNRKYFFNENEQFEAASLYKLAVMYTLFYLESKGKLNTSQSDIQDNMDAMIAVSSNEAALYLANNYTSWDEIAKLMLSKGLEDTNFNQEPFLTTPKDIATLLVLISEPGDISPEATGKMKKLLSDQTINDRIPALLPVGVNVFHKTGDVDDVSHDAGIVTGPNNINYILVIMTKNSSDPEEIKPIMAKISLDIFNLFNN